MSALQVTGSLFSLFGLSAIFLIWRHKGVRKGAWRYALPAGWGFLTLGLVLWGASTHPDQGIALGAVLIMVLACGFLAWQGLRLAGRPAKIQRERQSGSDTMAPGTGYWGRFAARLVGSLAIAPSAGLAMGLLWYAYVQGDGGDRLMGAGLVTMIAMTGGLVIQLASRRPCRALATLTVAGALAAGLALLPAMSAGGAP